MFGSSQVQARPFTGSLRSWSFQDTILFHSTGTDSVETRCEASHALGGTCGHMSFGKEVCKGPSSIEAQAGEGTDRYHLNHPDRADENLIVSQTYLFSTYFSQISEYSQDPQ